VPLGELGERSELNGWRGQKAWRAARRTLLEPLALTATAQIATLPITAPLFATVSLVSPLANLLATPFITLLVGVGIVALCLMPLLGPLGPLLIIALCAVADLAIGVAGWCARLPFACLAVSLDLALSNACALLGAAAVYRLWPQPSRKRAFSAVTSLVLIAMLLFLTTLLPAPPQVVMLDVGQGDAILVREGRSNVLIDTGESDATLLRALARQKVSRLDAVIITHLDKDHSGALDALGGTIPVEHVYFAAGLPETQATDEALRNADLLLGEGVPEELARGDTLRLGNSIELVMLWPDHRVSDGGNEESVCLGLDYDPDGDGSAWVRMLLVGDAEAPELTGLLAALPGDDARFDILKVGHHGSADAVTAAQLEQMGCRLAFISVGSNNRYGHPTAATLAVLEQMGLDIYRTDLNGDITLRFEKEAFSVICDTMAGESS
jgi:competence protein ComEC